MLWMRTQLGYFLRAFGSRLEADRVNSAQRVDIRALGTELSATTFHVINLEARGPVARCKFLGYLPRSAGDRVEAMAGNSSNGNIDRKIRTERLGNRLFGFAV